MKHYYIAIDRINGRKRYVELAESLNERGYDDRVEYFEGGWSDRCVDNIAPHLKFNNSEDAVAYTLAYGGTVLTDPPFMGVNLGAG